MENKFVYKIEYGSSSPVRFAQCKAVDSEGNEIIDPVCENCGLSKCRLMGRESFIYICNACGK